MEKVFKKLVIFRPHNVYGPDMGNEHVIPEFINRYKNLKKNFLKFKEQERKLDLLFILMIFFKLLN